MLRTCIRLAYEQGRVVIFLEPIALYMTKDLHEAGDNGWLKPYPEVKDTLALGDVTVDGSGDTVILSYANGYYLSQQAAKILKDAHNIAVTLVDMHWLSPLPFTGIAQAIKVAKRVLIVDEGRKSGSISEALMTWFMEQDEWHGEVRRLTGEDCFIPLGEAWKYVLPSRDGIVEAVCGWVVG